MSYARALFQITGFWGVTVWHAYCLGVYMEGFCTSGGAGLDKFNLHEIETSLRHP